MHGIVINITKKSKFLIFMIFIFCLSLTPSFALFTSSFSTSNLFLSKISYENFNENLNENYTDIIVEKPDMIHYPQNWESAFNNVNSSGISLLEITERYGGFIYINWPEYAHSKILIPNENYLTFIEILNSSGFNVRNNTHLTINLFDSRKIVGVPYEAGNTELTGEGIKIAIMDTGINDTHPDFGGPYGENDSRIVHWHDVISDYSYPYDDNGHGTHVASIAAGDGSASDGMYKGIAPNAKLIIEKACYGFGACDPDNVANAIFDAVENGADIISLSAGFGSEPRFGWCSGTTTETDYKALYDAVVNAINNGKVFIAAAGNTGNKPMIHFPACIDGVVAVGAAHKSGYPNDYFSSKIEDFSTTGIEPKSIVKIHAIATVISDNPQQVFEKEWLGTWSKDPLEKSIIVSGFQKLLKPVNWPATVKVEVEVEHISRDCNQEERIWWDPGTSYKGDEYWVWEKTFNYDSLKPGVMVEVGGMPKGEVGGFMSCGLDPTPYYKTYYNNYTCSGTAKTCSNFDLSIDDCKNQAGCYWCGCGIFIGGVFSTCDINTPQSQCNGCSGGQIQRCLQWLGCHGTPESCQSRLQENGKTCGNPIATGCTASWNKNNDVFVNIENVKSWEGIPTFFSSRGPALQNPNLIKPLVTAPGTDICAARAYEGQVNGDTVCGNINYVAMSGTSMATPMVSGLAALIKEAGKGNYFMTNGLIAYYLTLSDQNFFSPYPNMNEGYGRINATKALCLPSIEKIDTNFDNKIDIFDIVTVATTYGITEADPKWNSAADVNGDGLIDIFDLTPIAINFGKTC